MTTKRASVGVMILMVLGCGRREDASVHQSRAESTPSVVAPPAAPLPLGVVLPRPVDERVFLDLMKPLRERMPADAFQRSYEDTLHGFATLPGGGLAAFLKTKGFFCGRGGYKEGGVTAPSEIGDGRDPDRFVFFDRQLRPVVEVSKPGWNRFAVLDADGDPSTLELVRWSGNCAFDDPPFLVIHRLSDLSLAPMLVLHINPQALTKRIVPEDEVQEDGTQVSSWPRWCKPVQTGRWRFERNSDSRNDVVIEENREGRFIEAARFTMKRGAAAWEGPSGGQSHFWKVATNERMQAGFIRFAEFQAGPAYRGQGYGEIRVDVDQMKAAREAAKKAGLTD